MNQEDWELKYTPTRKRQEKHIKPHKNPQQRRFHKKIESSP
nr:hypothetical protein [Vulcanisaeta thermophila]